MHKKFLITASVIGTLSVALGAFGAHALKTMIDEKALAVFETAVRYQFYHMFALLAVAVLYQNFPGKLMLWAGRLFIAGIILFSGSLYLLTYLQAQNITRLKWVGAITPLGGVAFIVGWVLIAVAVAVAKKKLIP